MPLSLSWVMKCEMRHRNKGERGNGKRQREEKLMLFLSKRRRRRTPATTNDDISSISFLSALSLRALSVSQPRLAMPPPRSASPSRRPDERRRGEGEEERKRELFSFPILTLS